MPAAWEYEQAVNNVSNWYNTSADNVWNVVNGYNLTPEQTQALLPTVDSFLYGQGASSGYTAVKAADGTVMSWNNVASLQGNSANAVEQAVNSNAGSITQQMYQLPANTSYSGTGGTFNGTKGVTGGGSTVKVMSQVSAAVAAAGLGIKLGKAIDSTLYNLNPDFWDNNGMASLNPQTWNSITADMSDSGWEGTLKRAFNAIYGLDPNTGKSQMYLDADAAAYLAMYMDSKGVFPTGGSTVTSDWSGITNTLQGTYYHYYNDPLTMSGGYSMVWSAGRPEQEIDVYPQTANQRVFVIKKYNQDDPTRTFYNRIFVVSTASPVVIRNGSETALSVDGTYTIDGVTYKLRCEIVEVHPLTCTKCGSPLELHNGHGKCEYCGTSYSAIMSIVEDN